MHAQEPGRGHDALTAGLGIDLSEVDVGVRRDIDVGVGIAAAKDGHRDQHSAEHEAHQVQGQHRPPPSSSPPFVDTFGRRSRWSPEGRWSILGSRVASASISRADTVSA